MVESDSLAVLIFRFRRLEMKFVSLFVIVLAIVLATASLNAQENRKVAFYAIGAGAIDSNSSSQNLSYGLGTQVGGGVDINPEGFGLGLRFTNGSPVEQSFRRNIDVRPGDPEAYVNEQVKSTSRVFTAMFQKGFGNQKAKLILGAGPGVIMSKVNEVGTLVGPATYGSNYSRNSNSSNFVGAFGATVVVRAGQNLDLRFGVQYLRGFSGDKQSYFLPVGGAGVGF